MIVCLYVGSPFSGCSPFGCGRTAPKVNEEEGSYASRFYRWFLDSYKSCLLLLVALPGLIDTLAQLLAWRSLLWLSMTWRWRYLTESSLLRTTSLAWSLALHLLFFFSQEKHLRWKEINTDLEILENLMNFAVLVQINNVVYFTLIWIYKIQKLFISLTLGVNWYHNKTFIEKRFHDSNKSKP